MFLLLHDWTKKSENEVFGVRQDAQKLDAYQTGMEHEEVISNDLELNSLDCEVQH